jgi:hypothetical protein
VRSRFLGFPDGTPSAAISTVFLAAELLGEALRHLEAQGVDEDERDATFSHEGMNDLLVDGALPQAAPGQRPVRGAELEEGPIR